LATLNGHTIKLDDSGKIVPWDTSSPNAYDSFLDQRWNFIKTQVPNSPGTPPVSNYPEYYFYDGYQTTNKEIVPDYWMNDIGEKIPNWVESGRLYYAYTGDTAVMDIVRGLVDYTIDHGTSPSNFAWPNFPHTTNNCGQAEFTGFTTRFALHEVQVDHAADMGLAYYRMYQFYGDQKYLTAAVNVADVLAAHARVGTATQSVWPYRVILDSGTITAQYGANWAGAYSLLTELVAANIGNVSAYAAAASKARDFVLSYPMQTLLDPTGSMAGNWTDSHTDVAINSNTYKSNLSNSNMALYILEHPEFDPNWQTDLPNMIKWTETWFVTRTSGGEPATSYGANIVGEQDSFNYKMDYQTARYAAECALWYRESGDAAYLEKAYRSLNWVTYCSDANGRATESPYSTNITSWWSDCYGECPRMFYQVFAAMPEWAPVGENHLLYSEDVVHDVSYADNSVHYTAASGDGIEYLRVKFLPTSVSVNGVTLSQRSDLNGQGYTLRSLDGGDYALTIRRTGAANIAAEVSITTSSVATLGNSGPVAEGNPVAVNFTIPNDPGNLHYSFALTQAGLASSYNAAGTSKSTNFTFDDNGSYTVFGRLFNPDNTFTDYTTNVTVTNVAPTATFSNNGPVNANFPVTVRFSNPTDGSSADVTAGFHYSFALTSSGLATTYATAGTSTNQQFSFTTGGTFTVFGRIYDKDNGFTDYTTSVVVNGPTMLTDTTIADFTAGAPGTNTSVISQVSPVNDGGVSLAPAAGSEFSGTALPSGWTSTSWNSGGTATVSGGLLSVDGVRAYTRSTFNAGCSLEFRATFSGDAYQHVGFGVDFNTQPWAIFSTGSGGGLSVRTNNGASNLTTAISSSFLNSPHLFRIDWNSNNVVYSVDGTVVATHTVAISTAMRPIASDYTTGGGNVKVDWLRLGPFASSGSYLSRVFDGGASVAWDTASWTATTPTGTSVALLVRTGNTPTPDATWTSFVPIASSGATIGITARYLQYRADFTTNSPANPDLIPTLNDVTIKYSSSLGNFSVAANSENGLSSAVGTDAAILPTAILPSVLMKNSSNARFSSGMNNWEATLQQLTEGRISSNLSVEAQHRLQDAVFSSPDIYQRIPFTQT
jgi:hypothetical protein